jgi:hypothetical protein
MWFNLMEVGDPLLVTDEVDALLESISLREACPLDNYPKCHHFSIAESILRSLQTPQSSASTIGLSNWIGLGIWKVVRPISKPHLQLIPKTLDRSCAQNTLLFQALGDRTPLPGMASMRMFRHRLKDRDSLRQRSGSPVRVVGAAIEHAPLAPCFRCPLTTKVRRMR